MKYEEYTIGFVIGICTCLALVTFSVMFISGVDRAYTTKHCLKDDQIFYNETLDDTESICKTTCYENTNTANKYEECYNGCIDNAK